MFYDALSQCTEHVRVLNRSNDSAETTWLSSVFVSTRCLQGFKDPFSKVSSMYYSGCCVLFVVYNQIGGCWSH